MPVSNESGDLTGQCYSIVGDAVIIHLSPRQREITKRALDALTAPGMPEFDFGEELCKSLIEYILADESTPQQLM